MMPADPHRHLDDETLNAVLDGEASEKDLSDIDACADCSGRLERLRAVACALAEPGPPADAARRRAAIGAALRAGEPELAPASTPTSRRRQWMSPAWAAAAAVVVAGALAVPLVDRLGRTDDNQETATAARDADDTCPGCGSVADDEASSAGGDVAPSASGPRPVLGEIELSGLGELAASIRPESRSSAPEDLAAVPSPTAGAPLREQDGAPAAETTPPGALAEPGGSRAPPAAEPCEGAARQRDGTLGPLAYAADATVEGRPVVVLAFEVAPPDRPSALRLVVLATDTCAELGTSPSQP